MREKGYDQLPVSTPTGSRLVGLVTLGNLLSYISKGRATPEDPVSKVMFDFRRLEEVRVDPSDGSALVETTTNTASDAQAQAQAQVPAGVGGNTGSRRRLSTVRETKKRPFVEITRATPLSALSRFFEWNSAAVVTERDGHGHMRPVGVVTKVDLLSWMVRQQKIRP
jgi:cystathionine beta-synthase